MIDSQKAQIQKPHWIMKIFVGYLYFIQGIFLILPDTTCLLYDKFPEPHILSLFKLVGLPFSFKYLTAPLIQKVTNSRYGRRKTWVVVSLCISSFLMIFLSSIMTDPSKYLQTVVILTGIILLVSLEDISTDALSVKQLKSPVLASFLQSLMQPTGFLFGGTFFIKLVSPKFAQNFGYNEAFLKPSQVIAAIGILNLLFTFFVHLFYKQSINPQQESAIISIKAIFKYYKHFINPKYLVCRQIMYFLIVLQGTNFLEGGYVPDRIYQGFPKQIIADLQISALLLSFACNFILSRFITQNSALKYSIYILATRLVFHFITFMVDSHNIDVISFNIVVMRILSFMQFLLLSTVVNSFGNGALAGICITTMASFSNLGRNTFIHMQLISSFGYSNMAIFGMSLTVAIIGFSSFFIKWIKKGDPEQIIKVHSD